MKTRMITLFTGILLAAISLLANASTAGAGTTYQETLDLYIYSIGDINPDPAWTHTYDGSAWPEASVTLTIVADDVDFGEHDEVFINGNALGYLKAMEPFTSWSYYPGPGNPDHGTTTTTFNVPLSYLDSSMPVTVAVATMWGVEIETSTLTVAPGAPAVELAIDIKPWSDPNSINTKVRNGVIPVAILGTGELDVEAIDYQHLELYFGPEIGAGGATPAHTANQDEVFKTHIAFTELHDPDGVPGNGDEYMATANNDLIPDLVVHFKVEDTDFTQGDAIGYLWGVINGINVYGSDAVNIVK